MRIPSSAQLHLPSLRSVFFSGLSGLEDIGVFLFLSEDGEVRGELRIWNPGGEKHSLSSGESKTIKIKKYSTNISFIEFINVVKNQDNFAQFSLNNLINNS